MEGCAALTPDLVIVPAKLKDSIPQMEELGLTVLAVKPEDQDKLYGAIDLLAQATNTVARGEELKSAIEDNLLSLHGAIGDAEAPTVYMVSNSSVLQTRRPRHVPELYDREHAAVSTLPPVLRTPTGPRSPMSRCWTGIPTTSFWRPMPTMMSIPS